MECWACGTDLPTGAAYCSACGVPQDDDPDDLDEFDDAVDASLWDDTVRTPPTVQPYALWSTDPAPEPARAWNTGLGLRREGPIGKLGSLLSLPATIAAIYLAVRFWGENREISVRVLGALALYALAPFLVGIVFLPIALVLGFTLRRTSDETRWGAGAFGRSVFEGLSNIVSLAAIGYIFLRLWETFQ